MSKEVFESLDKLFESDGRVMISFKDFRIAGLQAIADLVFSHGGKIIPFNGVDITEFFRIGEEFQEGYHRLKEAIKEAVDHRPELDLKSIGLLDPDYYVPLGKPIEEKKLLKRLEQLAETGIDRPLKLINGEYMDPSPNSYLFEGKKVIVTGSDTGIGRAVALEFARRGAEVALHYPSQRFSVGAFSAVDLIRESGRKSEAFQGDFRDISEIGLFVQRAIDYLKGVDILVNNAGITLNKKFEETSVEDFNAVVNVNLGGAYFVTQKIVPYMKKRGKGFVINLSSHHAISGMAGHSVYAATKGAIISLTRQLAMELSPEIRVNAIGPGWVTGVNHFRLLPKLDFSEFGLENTPYGIDTPENLAKNLVSLASDDLSSLDGVNIMVDRGLSAGLSFGKSSTQVSDIGFGRRYL